MMKIFNSKLTKRNFLSASVLLPGAINTTLAQSDYPNKPIKLVFPFGPGAEVTTRAVLKSMSDKSVVVIGGSNQYLTIKWGSKVLDLDMVPSDRKSVV